MNAMRNGAESASETVSSIAAMMQVPAANGIAVGQKIALEATRFWARRVRAYVDQMELLAGCVNANQIVAAQAQFIERMQEEYAEESQAVAELLHLPNGNGEHRPPV